MVELGSGEHTYETSGEDWGELPDGWTYQEATAVAVDSGDNVYVYNRGGHAVIVYDRDGKMLRSWDEDVPGTPHGIAIGPDDSVYCVNVGNNAVRKYTQDGKLLLTIGPDNDPAPAMSGRPYNRPTHVAVDPRNGDLYVADGYSNARVHKYDPNGRYLMSWGESGTDEGQFNVVHNVAVDNDGRVLVADRENRRIQDIRLQRQLPGAVVQSLQGRGPLRRQQRRRSGLRRGVLRRREVQHHRHRPGPQGDHIRPRRQRGGKAG